ncbi:MAG: Gfo/Idh/MocA family oxidoreductase [Chloroflexota bacterium]|nr:MAG: Gfo/Idh/MocA family oxidoreductase [Chloroflexota bacterium]
MERIKVGFVGTGDVMLKYYLPTVMRASDTMEVVAICDALADRAEKVAGAFGASESYGDYHQMVERTSADLIVNLTPAQLHYPISLAALKAGKHVYVEKPMARTLDEANTLISTARSRGVQLMAAPTLMLDPTNQTIRRLIKEEIVGKVAFAVANAFQGGPLGPSYMANYESALARAGINVLNRLEDKTDPSWFYQKGGGPLYDVGVYRITLLTGLLGPVQRVTALSGIRTPERTVSHGLGGGRTFKTDEDDNTLVLLDFGDATFAYVSASWHGTASEAPPLEVVCQHGTISLPRSTRGEERAVRVHREGKWEEIPVEGTPWVIPNGLPYFAQCLLDGTPSVVTVEQARHVVEVMEKALTAARTGEAQDLVSTFDSPLDTPVATPVRS